MVRISISSCLMLFILLFALPEKGWSDIYKYVDENGVIHFTDNPTSGKYNLYIREHAGKVSIQDLIRHYAGVFRLDEDLVKAVVKVESDYNPRAVSTRGARGLMQLMPETARDMRVADPFDPEENIRGGTRYLRQMLDKFKGNIELALAAYNAGPSAVRHYGGVPPYEETRNYVIRVKKYLRHLRTVGGAVL